MSLKARLRSLEKQAAEKLDLCPRCGGKHIRSWLSFLWTPEEEWDDTPLCECKCCAEAVRYLAWLFEEGGKDEAGGEA